MLSGLLRSCARFIGAQFIFFSRRHKIEHYDALILPQAFLADLIKIRASPRADPMKGRFRSFLLGTLKHFLGHARDRERAQKRGGGVLPVRLDERAIEEADTHAARCRKWSADGVFEREWAAALLRQARYRLSQEYLLARHP